uniref:Uncharacterized protein n=1 Tax=Knipowitschia caucasica TaxID=637954 RepID=A0AAV2MTE8_KNICA
METLADQARENTLAEPGMLMLKLAEVTAPVGLVSPQTSFLRAPACSEPGVRRGVNGPWVSKREGRQQVCHSSSALLLCGSAARAVAKDQQCIKMDKSWLHEYASAGKLRPKISSASRWMCPGFTNMPPLENYGRRSAVHQDGCVLASRICLRWKTTAEDQQCIKMDVSWFHEYASAGKLRPKISASRWS